MPFVMPGEGALSTLIALKVLHINTEWSAGLYVNDPLIDYNLTLADIEPAFGFEDIPALGLRFSEPQLDESGRAFMVAGELSWVLAIPVSQDVRGWFSYDTAGKLCMIERFPRLQHVSKAGHVIVINNVTFFLHS